jgi:hypothetical protein
MPSDNLFDRYNHQLNRAEALCRLRYWLTRVREEIEYDPADVIVLKKDIENHLNTAFLCLKMLEKDEEANA